MNAREQLRSGVAEFVDVLGPWVDEISDLAFKSAEGITVVVYHCILRRQFDGLRTLVALASSGSSDKGVPLLRPACEELMWTAYLRKLARDDVEAILQAKSLIENAQTVRAQARDVGEAEMSGVGFTPDWIGGLNTKAAAADEGLRVLGRRLGWRMSRRSAVPSMRQIAEMAGQVEVYDVIYHATSRTVHFTTMELFRLAWGAGSGLRISSDMMSGYWEGFSLYWGWRLFMFTTVEIMGTFLGTKHEIADFSEAQKESVARLGPILAKCGPVPILTPEEMNMHLGPGAKTAFD